MAYFTNLPLRVGMKKLVALTNHIFITEIGRFLDNDFIHAFVPFMKPPLPASRGLAGSFGTPTSKCRWTPQARPMFDS